MVLWNYQTGIERGRKCPNKSQFSGRILASLGGLYNLASFSLEKNYLTGAIDEGDQDENN